ncbi:hypothetical protein N7G274_000784 [Stereocaulon virgatum]|uniref:Uncharacterized protein n=1 Tax=Stereocaulon virgatum TaxID=373712 RepID=A0ABR4APS2_9LECA
MVSTRFEDNVLLNKVNIALAKTQRQIASWLPPKKTEDTQANSEKEIEEEQEVFIPAPEVLGLGGVIPKDGEVKRHALSSNDKLRKQLLGNGYTEKHADRNRRIQAKDSHRSPLPAGSKQRPAQAKPRVEDDSEDDRGRSSLGKSKMGAVKRPDQPSARSDENKAVDAEVLTDDGPTNSPRPLKRASDYIDEVLADRSRKKHKKNKKKKQIEVTQKTTSHF